MQAWWAVAIDKNSEPVAMFKYKPDAEKYKKEEHIIYPMNFFEDEFEANFLSEAEEIW